MQKVVNRFQNKLNISVWKQKNEFERKIISFKEILFISLFCLKRFTMKPALIWSVAGLALRINLWLLPPLVVVPLNQFYIQIKSYEVLTVNFNLYNSFSFVKRGVSWTYHYVIHSYWSFRKYALTIEKPLCCPLPIMIDPRKGMECSDDYTSNVSGYGHAAPYLLSKQKFE